MTDYYTPALLRHRLDDYAKQLGGAPTPEALGLEDEYAMEAVIQLIRHYPVEHPDMPDDPRECALFKDIIGESGTASIQTALRNGQLTELNYWKGITDNRIEATGYEKLVGELIPAAQQMLIKGAKGSGKSTKAADLVSKLHSEFDGNLKVITNIKGLEEHPDVEFAEKMSDYLLFARRPGEKVALIDEASTVMAGYASLGGSDVIDQFGRAINALRKGEGGSTRLIIIGHRNDADIAPMLRRQSDVVMYADGKVKEDLIDKATVYGSWDEFKKERSSYKVYGLQDINDDSPWSFESNYFATFEFDLDDPENQIRRGKIVDNWESYQESPPSGESGEETAQDTQWDTDKVNAVVDYLNSDEGLRPIAERHGTDKTTLGRWKDEMVEANEVVRGELDGGEEDEE
ncbi:hypothetical protein OB920_13150 [Halobacteria archaeon HArc-gm2]|nr:hypothetical protein [Halobacteria archaeon HArc-gm2]